MNQAPKMLIAGNWKMNGAGNELSELNAIASGVTGNGYDALICTPATLIERAAKTVEGSALNIGGQDCHAAANGAHTGDISAGMLKDAGANFVILGHSERRADHHEDDALIAAKAVAAANSGLNAIICVGETKDEREAGNAAQVVESQLAGSIPVDIEVSKLVIAYEPVWAIGTGLVASPDDIAQMHAHIRGLLNARFGAAGEGVSILYGGSMKPGNAADILTLDNVNGGLIGGASLKSDDFLAICGSVPA